MENDQPRKTKPAVPPKPPHMSTKYYVAPWKSPAGATKSVKTLRGGLAARKQRLLAERRESAPVSGWTSLPAEIRIAIWKLCLPRRVVGIDNCVRDGSERGGLAKRHGRRYLPLISRVCYEARQVALEQGRLYICLQHRSGQHKDEKADVVWFDGGRDVLFLDGWLTRAFWMDPRYLLYAAIHAREVAVYMPRIRRRAGRILGSQWATRRRHPPRLIFCEDHFVVRATFEAAVDSGLFGLWAEETLILVDPSNRDKLDKLSRLKCVRTMTGYEHELPSGGRQDATVEECASESRMAGLRRMVEDRWLDCTRCFLHGESAFTLLDGVFWRFPRDHARVTETLSEMPPFDIALAFELRMPRKW